MALNNTGLGIGTTSPDAKLTIISGAKGIHVDKGSHSSSSVNIAECRTNYAFAYDTLRNGSTTGFFITNVNSNTPAIQVGDSSNNAQPFSIQPFGGNVGIGTTSPASKLDVNGNIAIKGNPIINRTGNVLTIGDIDNIDSVANISIDSANGSTIVLLDDNGHVGFNETSPNSTVDINGTAMEQLRLRTPGGPSSNSDISGREGDFAYDDLYLYIKTGSGWGRVALDFAF
jgi:hypothetical protein